MKQPRVFRGVVGELVMALVLLSVFSANLSFIRVQMTGSDDLLFLIWNLLLAWIPLIFAWLLYSKTAQVGLSWSWQNGLFFTVWLLFLPNALYMITDFVHLEGYFDEPQRLFDIVLITSYALTGMVLGLLSLLLVHIRAVQRLGPFGHWLPIVALLLSGFAIYLGRYLRWNSWDVLINPFALLFDVSDRIINPTSHSLTFSTTLLFFSFFGLFYLFAWRVYKVAVAKQLNQ